MFAARFFGRRKKYARALSWVLLLFLSAGLSAPAAATTTAGAAAQGGAPLATLAQPGNPLSGLPACPPEDESNPSAASAIGPAIVPARPNGSLAAPALALSPESDTGVSNSDGLTGNNMPTFIGSAPAGTLVRLFDGGALIGAAIAGASGRWSYAVNECSAFSDGVHRITTQASDGKAAASALSRALMITIKTDAPAMPVIDAPANHGRGEGGRVTLTGKAEANSTIKLLDGTSVKSIVHADGHGAWKADLTGVSQGHHAYRAVAVDAAGNESPAFNVQQVTMDPTIALPLVTGSPSGSTTIAPVIAMASGDIACGATSGGDCQQKATASILTATNPTIVLPLGDNQYECGSLSDFQSYYGPSWGQLKSKSHPAAGNHEYQVDTTAGQRCYGAPSGAPGYYTYFGSAASPTQPGCTVNCNGYYSYDVGSWHFIVLNSNCSQVGGCGLSSPQETWLKDDLATHTNACTVAYWHYPRFTSGLSGTAFLNSLKAFWQDLYNGGVDIILNGHDHDYERFARMDVNGNLDTAHGMREFVVGTGGKSHQSFGTIAANSQVRNSSAFGVLRLTLNSGSYSWRFMPVSGQTFSDLGSENCH